MGFWEILSISLKSRLIEELYFWIWALWSFLIRLKCCKYWVQYSTLPIYQYCYFTLLQKEKHDYVLSILVGYSILLVMMLCSILERNVFFIRYSFLILLTDKSLIVFYFCVVFRKTVLLYSMINVKNTFYHSYDQFLVRIWQYISSVARWSHISTAHYLDWVLKNALCKINIRWICFKFNSELNTKQYENAKRQNGVLSNQ